MFSRYFFSCSVRLPALVCLCALSLLGLVGCDRDTPAAQTPQVKAETETRLGFSALPPIPHLHERAVVEGQLTLAGTAVDWSGFRVQWVFDEQPLGDVVAAAADGRFRLPRPLQDAPSGLWAEAWAGAYRLRGKPDELGRLQLDALSTARAALSNGSRAEPANPQLEPLHNILHAVLREGLGEDMRDGAQAAAGYTAAPLLAHYQSSWQLAQVLARSPVHRIAFQLRHQQVLADSFALLHQQPDFSHGDLSEQQRMVRLDRWGTPLRWQHRPYQEQAWGCVDYLQLGQRWLVSEESATPLALNTLQQRLGELSQQHFCGQDQWRLPTATELHSLINSDNGDWAFPLSLPFAGSNIYWVQDEQGQAQIFDLQRNTIIRNGKQAHWLPLVVRGEEYSMRSQNRRSVSSNRSDLLIDFSLLQALYGVAFPGADNDQSASDKGLQQLPDMDELWMQAPCSECHSDPQTEAQTELQTKP